MSQKQVFKINESAKSLERLPELDFTEAGFKERYDIQEWVESHPSILGEDLLIIGKEFSGFDKTNERPDLIAIDKKGNLVIIELKRDESGKNTDLQAIKYASYLSNFENEEILNLFLDYKNIEGEADLKSEIINFIDEPNLDNVNNRQRIILASHRFSNEVITSVKWLRESYNLDIKCVTLSPFLDSSTNSYFLQSDIIFPISGVDKYIIGYKTNEKKNATPISDEVNDEITNFSLNLYDVILEKMGENCPTKRSRWAGGKNSSKRYFHIWFNEDYWGNWILSYKIWFSRNYESNKVKLSFSFHKKDLLVKGFGQQRFEQLISFVKNSKELAELGFSYDKSDAFDGVAKYITNDIEKIANCCVQLIKITKKQFDKLIND